jgi:predicted dehydrogenase
VIALGIALGVCPRLSAAYAYPSPLTSPPPFPRVLLQTANAGKAVLIEKPTAVSTQELETIVAACAAAKVQFFDGTMFNHHARMAQMRAFLDAPTTGRILRMSSGFTFMGDADFHKGNIRVDKTLEPFGSVGDLGWYSIRFALWAMKWALPTHVRARAEQWSPAGVPIDVTAQLVFGREPGSPQMLFDCGFTTPFRQWMEVSGAEGGVLRLDDFVITRTHAKCDFTTVQNPGLDALHSNVLGETAVVEVRGCNQEAEMWKEFARLVAGGAPDPHWPRISLLTQCVLDACMASINAGGKDVDVVAPTSGV